MSAAHQHITSGGATAVVGAPFWVSPRDARKGGGVPEIDVDTVIEAVRRVVEEFTTQWAEKAGGEA